MAADGVDSLALIIVHGQDKHRICLDLPNDEAGDVLTVGHLASTVETITGIPVGSQKLIVKGRSLTDPSACLGVLGLKNGSKVMLLGKKINIEDDNNMKAIRTVEAEMQQSDKKLSEIIYEVDGISRGYLASDLKEEALGKLSRRLAVVSEDLTRQLEKLDCLSLGPANAEIKAKRKAVVQRIQSLLDRGDTMNSGIDELLH